MLRWINGSWKEDNRKNVTIYEMINRNNYVREYYMDENSEPNLKNTYRVIKKVITLKR